jgi:hypothetical protein
MMKAFIWGFVIGIVLTIGGGLIFVLPGYQEIFHTELQTQLSQASLKLQADQMCLLTSNKGQALLDFTRIASSSDFSYDAEADYRWRYKPYNQENKRTGSGTVFERYEPAHQEERQTEGGTEERMEVKDMGSQVIIQAGTFQLKYSMCGSTCVWIYYDSEQVKVQRLPAQMFETYSFTGE